MKAAVLEKYNHDLIFKEVSKPIIREHDDVIIRVAATGVCRTDIHIKNGDRMDRTTLPLIMGHESVGFIEDIENEGSIFSKGQPVILYPWVTCGYCNNCRKGNDVFCTGNRYQPGIEKDGGYAEFLKTKVRSLVPIPEGLTNKEFIRMAPLSDAAVTAYHAIRKLSHLYRHNSRLVVLGAGGGLGHIAVQMLKTMTPSKIIALDSSEKGLKLALDLGADYGILSGADGGVKDLMKITGGEGADVVFDFVGEGSVTTNSIGMIRKQGTLSIIGNGGSFTESTHDMIIREINILGNLTGTYVELREVVDLYLEGTFKVVGPEYRLSDVNKALGDLKNGKFLGRAIMIPGK